MLKQLCYDGAGLGARGISAIKQLVRHGGVGGPEIWCLDVDRNSLDVPSANIHALETDVVSSLHLQCSRQNLRACWQNG